MFMHILFTFE